MVQSVRPKPLGMRLATGITERKSTMMGQGEPGDIMVLPPQL